MADVEVSYSGNYEVLNNDGVTYYVANTTRPDEPDYHVAQKIVHESPSIRLGDWSYSVNNNEITIIRYEGIDNEVTIPTEINNIPVKIIGKSAFNTYPLLKKLIIKDNITKIEDFAFGNCTNLTDIQIPNSVTSIGKGVFGNCKSLVSISIPNTITSIEEMTFGGCENLRNVNIPNSVTNIGVLAFSACINLTRLYIPNRTVKIDPTSFEANTQIKIA
jgi:hypothetical protein